MAPDCLYQVLGIVASADEQQVKKAYRRLALKWHPDKNPQNKDLAEQRFKQIAQAYEILSDKEQRRLYDQWGIGGMKGGGTPTATSKPNYQQHRRAASNGTGSNTGGGGTFGHDHFSFKSPFDVFRDFFDGRDPFQEFMNDETATFMSFPVFPDTFDNIFFGSLAHRRKHHHRQHHVAGIDRLFAAADHLHHHHHHHHRRAFAPTGGDENDCAFSSIIRFSAGQPGKNASARKTTTSTRIVDGKKVVTKRIVEDESGTETIEITEDGILKSSLVLDHPTTPTAAN